MSDISLKFKKIFALIIIKSRENVPSKVVILLSSENSGKTTNVAVIKQSSAEINTGTCNVNC